jgi:chromosome segregation ATPase
MSDHDELIARLEASCDVREAAKLRNESAAALREQQAKIAEYEALLTKAGEAFTEGSACIAELQARLAEVEAFNRSMSQSCSTIAEQRDGYKARLASFEEDERDMNPVFHCGCIFDPESKDGNAPPTSECLYHERLRAQLGEANEALAACQSQAGPCIKDAERYRWAMRNGLIFIRGDDCSLEPWSEADIDAAREGGK